MEELFEASWLTLVNAMWRKGNTPAGHDTHYPTLTKFVGCGAARRITRGCLDLLGQDGTSKSHFLEQAMRDSRIMDIYEGPSEVLKLFIARWLLGFKKSELN
jgi:acyl-CoA dehydrogenase